MVHWLYTRVIRPSILYGALVWWPKVIQKTTKTQLGRIKYGGSYYPSIEPMHHIRSKTPFLTTCASEMTVIHSCAFVGL